jgi:Tfp pilus assembly protein FimT
MTRPSLRGFTLIEAFLSIALITVLGGIGAPILQSAYTRISLDIDVATIVGTLRRAETLARTMQNDTEWGVSLTDPGIITVFSGTDYSTRDVSRDEVSTISPALSILGTEEIIFAKRTGYPPEASTITISSYEESRILTVNEKGTINY